MNIKTTLRFTLMTALIATLGIASHAAGNPDDEIYDTKADGRTQIDNAIAKAKKEDKNVLITWGANWCSWCHHLKAQREGDEQIKAVLNDAFISISIDLGNRNKHMDLAREYGLEFNDLKIPHMSVLDQDGEMVGNQEPGDLAVEVAGNKGNGQSGVEYSADKILAFLEAHQPNVEKAE